MMKRINYILVLIIGIVFFNSCEKSSVTGVDFDSMDESKNIAGFAEYKANLNALANGDEYVKEITVFVTGPNLEALSSDVTVTVSADASSTAEEGVHYRLTKPTVTLSASNNYIGVVELVMTTEGNTPPMDGTPEFEDYVAPVLYLKVEATGDGEAVATGKLGDFTLNFVPPNPYAGKYDSHVIYRHPSVGEYPDNIASEADFVLDFVAVTGRKCEVEKFGVWEGVTTWITINADNSIKFEVDLLDWGNEEEQIKLGDPFDASKVSHYDPETGVIYLYYHYSRSNGTRVFWETCTPQF